MRSNLNITSSSSVYAKYILPFTLLVPLSVTYIGTPVLPCQTPGVIRVSVLGLVLIASRQGFSPGTPVSSPPSSVNGFSQLNKAKTNTISTLSNLTAELSLRTKWHTAGCT